VISSDIVKSNYFTEPCQIVKASLTALLMMGLALRFAGAQTAFAEGEDLFLRNKPAEALVRLETALREDPANVSAALYLGLTYQQLGRLDDAIQTFRKILPQAGARRSIIAYNLGNVYFQKGAAAFAEQYYTQAIEDDASYASAYLNRANARIRTGALNDASVDYGRYLALEPASPKRPEIERILSLINETFAAEERSRVAAEEAVKAAEEKRTRLLNEVSESLQAAAEETRGLSAGTEDVMQYDGEFVLE
jgi:tetratricopeptide (TPR) repeat protein